MKIRISGVVQGVGFRPFIYNLALKKGLNGYVLNDSRGVEIVVSGEPRVIAQFVNEIPEQAPPRSEIDSLVTSEYTGNEEFQFFSIRESLSGAGKFTRISPDLMVCEDCIQELLDPENRRYFYPFINCTNCGPRYSIIMDVPYDRPKTTMAVFKMCPECQGEYENPLDRRFHAQPNACHRCGPHLTLIDNKGKVVLEEHDSTTSRQLFEKVAELLLEGYLVAIKGIGGFHIACDATNETVVSELRLRKYREAKPFAIMVRDPAQLKELAFIDEPERERILQVDRPILLLPRRKEAQIAPSVAPDNMYLGIMLPYTPIHYLLFQCLDIPLVMTSGNVSDEPIAYKNQEALQRLSGIADYFLMGDREIHIRCDDSVTRLWRGLEYPIRRSRGNVPTPIRLEESLEVMVLGVGAEQKNVVCIARDEWAIPGHHIGDLENLETLRSFQQSIEHLCRVFDIKPSVIGYDLHPDYLSTKFVQELPDEFQELLGEASQIGIQHHHAHVVSCMADNGISGKVIGVALDGTGYGIDGTIWGGEILIADEIDFRRVVTFEPVKMPGGQIAIKEPWRMAVSYFQYAGLDDWSFFTERLGLPEKALQIVLHQLNSVSGGPLTSSCGRLFDGVAALTGMLLRAHYEGQPAVEFEQRVVELPEKGYHFSLKDKEGLYYIDFKEVIRTVYEDLQKKKSISSIAASFHRGLIDILREALLLVSKNEGLKRVVLSGGCFMNMILLDNLYQELTEAGLEVYTHRRIPCNDGGISLGQVIIAYHKFMQQKER